MARPASTCIVLVASILCISTADAEQNTVVHVAVPVAQTDVLSPSDDDNSQSRISLKMPTDLNGKLVIPESTTDAVRLLRASLPQKNMDELVWLYGFQPRRKMPRRKVRLDWRTDVHQYLATAWHLGGPNGTRAKQFECMILGEGSLTPIEILAVREETIEKDLKPRRDIPPDFSLFSPFLLSERLHALCLEGPSP